MVSIAFRRSPRSGPFMNTSIELYSKLVSIAFRRSPRSGRNSGNRSASGWACLHCLSAFTAFRPAVASYCITGTTDTSPLPFGVHRVPAREMTVKLGDAVKESPLPFGVHRVPAVLDSSKAINNTLTSPLPFGVHRVPALWIWKNTPHGCLSPLPFGVHRVPALWQRPLTALRWFCLHCLSAFTAFRPTN